MFWIQQVDVTIHGFKFGNPPGAEAVSVSLLDSVCLFPPIPVRAIRSECLRLVSNHQIEKQRTLRIPLHVDLCFRLPPGPPLKCQACLPRTRSAPGSCSPAPAPRVRRLLSRSPLVTSPV